MTVFGYDIQWQQVYPKISDGFMESIVYGNGRYVVGAQIAEGVIILTSTDLSDWEQLPVL
jgi:hypothetical protein